MPLLHNGSASAFQADSVGSIPINGSWQNKNNILENLVGVLIGCMISAELNTLTGIIKLYNANVLAIIKRKGIINGSSIDNW